MGSPFSRTRYARLAPAIYATLVPLQRSKGRYQQNQSEIYSSLDKGIDKFNELKRLSESFATLSHVDIKDIEKLTGKLEQEIQLAATLKGGADTLTSFIAEAKAKWQEKKEQDEFKEIAPTGYEPVDHHLVPLVNAVRTRSLGSMQRALEWYSTELTKAAGHGTAIAHHAAELQARLREIAQEVELWSQDPAEEYHQESLAEKIAPVAKNIKAIKDTFALLSFDRLVDGTRNWFQEISDLQDEKINERAAQLINDSHVEDQREVYYIIFDSDGESDDPATGAVVVYVTEIAVRVLAEALATAAVMTLDKLGEINVVDLLKRAARLYGNKYVIMAIEALESVEAILNAVIGTGVLVKNIFDVIKNCAREDAWDELLDNLEKLVDLDEINNRDINGKSLRRIIYEKLQELGAEKRSELIDRYTPQAEEWADRIKKQREALAEERIRTQTELYERRRAALAQDYENLKTEINQVLGSLELVEQKESD